MSNFSAQHSTHSKNIDFLCLFQSSLFPEARSNLCFFMKSFPDIESILTCSFFEISSSLACLPLMLALVILLCTVIELFQDFLVFPTSYVSWASNQVLSSPGARALLSAWVFRVGWQNKEQVNTTGIHMWNKYPLEKKSSNL